MNRKNVLRTLTLAALAVLAAAPQQGAETRRITLTEAVHLAISQNHSLKIARFKVVENEQKKAGDHSAYFPQITNQSNILHITELENIVIPAGGLGAPAGALVPPVGINLNQGKNTLFSSGTQLSQPLTQLIRIHAANRMAAAEVASSRDDVKKVEEPGTTAIGKFRFCCS